MTAMSLRWSFRQPGGKGAPPPASGKRNEKPGLVSDPASLERSWLAAAVGLHVLRGALAGGSSVQGSRS